MPFTVDEVAASALAGLPLFEGAPFQSSPGWWRAASGTAVPPGCRPTFRIVRQDGRPVLLLPLLRTQGRHCSGFVTPYTCLYQPLAAAAADLSDAATALGRGLGPVLRLDAIDPAWDGWAELLAGFRRVGYLARPFASFVNWREPLGDRAWESYVAARPGPLRTTLRRRLRSAELDPSVSIALAGRGEEALFLADYERVYAESWKQPEPYPGFAPAFIAEAAAAGVLRIAALRREGVPLAAQYWTVDRGTATLLKLAHVETARRSSPGTVLTAWMIRRLIEVERVTALDFGRGDDAYKANWATERRVRGGLIIADWRHPAGAAALLRQAAGQAARRFRG